MIDKIAPAESVYIQKTETNSQARFETAIQNWDFNALLEVLKEGSINPHVLLTPTQELAQKLIEETKLGKDYQSKCGESSRIESFCQEYEVPAWILFSQFSEGDSRVNLRTEILDLIKSMIDEDFDARYDELYAEVLVSSELDDTPELKDFFYQCFRIQIEHWKNDYNYDFEYTEEDFNALVPFASGYPECDCHVEGIKA